MMSVESPLAVLRRRLKAKRPLFAADAGLDGSGVAATDANDAAVVATAGALAAGLLSCVYVWT